MVPRQPCGHELCRCLRSHAAHGTARPAHGIVRGTVFRRERDLRASVASLRAFVQIVFLSEAELTEAAVTIASQD